MAARTALFAVLALVPAVQSQVPVDIPEDMGCEKGVNAATWKSVKSRFRNLVDEQSPGIFSPVPREAIKKAVDGAVADLTAVGGFKSNDCGLGRLSIQLLTLATLDDPQAVLQLLQQSNQISSPVLTMLLDIPWVATAMSGWPFFGILAQVGMHKIDLLKGFLNSDVVDGLDKAAEKAYFTEVQSTQAKSDLIGMAEAAYKYLAGETGGIMAPLNALATQAAVQTDVKSRMEACGSLQQSFRNVIRNAEELDFALSTRWPIWSLLHLTVGAFAKAGA
eukprot:TRINITY_DN18650_c0_g1_i2.p1 TRINITY_DN18650_c0_g1~~TRINITY_DN18650_c0_g1_i2.p1  ORF type:complete len:304 (+),score=85.86 TRINITY_DN18650_c0_g1_i2:82-912(+)